MAADRGISPTQARRLARHLEQAAERIEHERRAAAHELAGAGWPAPAELHALAGLADRLHASADDLRRAADHVEHQKVRPFACFGPPRRHGSNPFFSFGKGVALGVTGTVKGLSHLVADFATLPVQVTQGAMHGKSPESVVAHKVWGNVHALWESRTTFWHASLPYLAIETQRHGAARAVDEWAYANGAITPFVVVTIATAAGGSSPLAAGLRATGVPAATATRTAQILGTMNPAPPTINDGACEEKPPHAA
ncbi:MAG: hypothetical protein JWO37_2582 [Acidimicrobiales bacterium]|jgi:hypothetical protein|nr:hypothetical protein [Acidimicrobiales bacterium]